MVNLVRTSYTDGGVRGILLIPGLNTVIHTIENPWVNNERRVSCIPTDTTYDLVENYYFGGGYNSVQIEGVPNRDNIQIHVANFPEQVEGCVGVGLEKGELSGKPAVLRSREAFFSFVQPALLDLVPTRIRVQDLETTSLDPLLPEELEVKPVEELLEAVVLDL